jgi:hypothetical protein
VAPADAGRAGGRPHFIVQRTFRHALKGFHAGLNVRLQAARQRLGIAHSGDGGRAAAASASARETRERRAAHDWSLSAN